MANSSIDALLASLRKGLEAILEEAREEGRNEVRSMLSGIVSPPRRGRAKRAAAAAPAAKRSSKKRKSAWARLTDDEYIARVNGIRKGRGMALLNSAQAAEKLAERHGTAKKKRKKRKSAWDTYTPEQRKSHLEAMKGGRKKAAAKRKRKR